MIENTYGIWDVLAIIFAVPLLLLILIAFVVNVWLPFIRNRHYIKKEMHRSDGGEYRYWKRELKLLYLRHIPIVGWFFREKYR